MCFVLPYQQLLQPNTNKSNKREKEVRVNLVREFKTKKTMLAEVYNIVYLTDRKS